MSFSQINGQEKLLGYVLSENQQRIKFVFDPRKYLFLRLLGRRSGFSKVYVEGSFNGWDKKNNDYQMRFDYAQKVWILEKTVAEINIPGNAGVPEFKFVAYLKFFGIKTEYCSASKDLAYSLCGNALIHFSDEDLDKSREANVICSTQLKLKDFNLDLPEDKLRLSNVRKVPGTTCLFRGYHPFKKSRPKFDTEELRSTLVKESFESNKINSVITLSGEELPEPKYGEYLCDRHKEIMQKGNNLYINTDYNIVYYHSNEEEFGKVIATVVRFINKHPGPYYIHCRLGTDRTGTVSACLAALAGASWEEIAQDYMLTNKMGLREYRDSRLLKYSFEKILGKPISEVKKLKKEFGLYFEENGFLTKDELELVSKRLNK